MKDQQCLLKQPSSSGSTKNTQVGSFIFLGTVFDVCPKDNAVCVDGDERKSLFGQVDMWDSCVRYYSKRKVPEIRKTLLHEWFHLFVDWIRSETLTPAEQDIDQMADLLYTFLLDNDLWNEDAWKRIIPTEREDESDRQLQQDVVPPGQTDCVCKK